MVDLSLRRRRVMADLSLRRRAAISEGSRSPSSNQSYASRISSSDSFLYGSRRATFIGAGAGALAGMVGQNLAARAISWRS